MKIRDIIDYLRSDMNLIVRDCVRKTGETFDIYNGEVINLPYWIAELTFTAEECIEVENNSIIIGVGEPIRKTKDIETNQQWLDTLSEEDTLLNLAGFLYHYDSGTIHDESFDDNEWQNAFNPIIDYVEKRIGTMSFNEKMHNWFRTNIK